MNQRVRIIVCAIFAFFSLSVASTAQEVSFTLLRSSGQDAVIRVDFPTYTTTRIEANGMTMGKLSMNNAFPILEAGAPELLTSAVSLIIPENATPTVEFIKSDYDLVQNFNLVPSKGNLKRNVNIDDVPYTKGAAYSEDRFIGNDSVEVGEPYQLRDYNGVAFKFFPFAYNPVQKVLKVYHSIVVRVNYNGTLTRQPAEKLNKTFDAIYEKHFLNYKNVRTAELPENGDILIICPDNFCEAMQPYVDWKIQTGYPTVMVALSTVGNTSTAVKNYIQDYYDNHNLGFVVIVGDNEQFPVLNVYNQASDNHYVHLAGNDRYPDALLGKISAETVAQVETQVQRSIDYEKNPVETAHFPVFCGIASDEGYDLKDYEHIRNLGTMLSAYTYNANGYEIFDGSQGGQDAPGDANASLVSQAVNSGVGIINYCGHGADTYWVSSHFSTSNVNSLTNMDKLPFIISVACVNGNYVNQTCFAEAWMRATKNGRPTGAVSTLMSTVNQSWEPPQSAQREMVKYLTGNSNYPRFNTFGAITCNGIIKMLDEYGSEGEEDARTWILFGDPALCVRTAVPEVLTIEYQEQVPFGIQSVTVNSAVEGATIALSHQGQVIGKETITGGIATFTIPDNLDVLDTIHVVGTAMNYLPAEGNIVLIPNEGPYVICKDMSLTDNGNHDGNADYGEVVTINPTFRNVGSENAANVTVKYRTADPYITLVDSTLTFNSLNASADADFSNAFKIKVADNVPANYNVHFTFYITCAGNHVFEQKKTMTIHAPELAIGELVIDDAAAGNNNGRLDSNETANLVIKLENLGNGNAGDGMVTVTNPDGQLHIFRPMAVVEGLDREASTTVVFNVKVLDNVEMPASAVLHVTYKVDNYEITKDILVKIGLLMEDFESGDFSANNWVNNSSKKWSITTQNVYDGQYAARSGKIGDNAKTTLSITQTTTAADSISFYYYVSCEQGYDDFKFYIDNSLKGTWSGEVAWSRASYEVMPGHHTYKWVYSKDIYMSSGKDMAMIDNVIFPSLKEASGTGIEEQVSSGILLMPNPATDHVHIMLPEGQDLSETHCMIYDIRGQLLRNEPIRSTMENISLTDLAQGLYIFRIMDNNATIETFKVVKH